MGRRARQESLFVLAEELPRSGGHPFYQKLNRLLAEAEFDRWVEGSCADSLSLRQFLGLGLADPTPDHLSLTRIRQRLPLEVDTEVFQFVRAIAEQKRLLAGQTVGVASTTLEANAVMKSIVRCARR